MNRRGEMLSIEHTLMCLVKRNLSQIIARPWGHSSQLDDVFDHLVVMPRQDAREAITDDAGNEVAPAQETPGSCRYSCPFSECCGIALDGFSKWLEFLRRIPNVPQMAGLPLFQRIQRSKFGNWSKLDYDSLVWLEDSDLNSITLIISEQSPCWCEWGCQGVFDHFPDLILLITTMITIIVDDR